MTDESPTGPESAPGPETAPWSGGTPGRTRRIIGTVVGVAAVRHDGLIVHVQLNVYGTVADEERQRTVVMEIADNVHGLLLRAPDGSTPASPTSGTGAATASVQ